MLRSRDNPNKGKKVFVGLSGGVDSAVSAALLQKEGYDVVGAFIRIALPGYPCSAGQDKIDAMRVAAHLRIPFKEADLSKEYQKKVFEISMKEFERGRTPNPDALCNREIKFGIFYDWALSQGADYIATGHYARTMTIPETVLLAGIDSSKDQSYFLWAVPQDRLAKTLFPVGHLRKVQVRALAKKFGLPNAGRPDSQGLCFLGDVSIGDMLHRELTLVPGDVLDKRGEVVGRHEGVQAYTLGQRHGFSLFAATPDTKPHYVIAKDVEFNTLTVSADKRPRGSATVIELGEANWIGEAPDGPCLARFRYRQELMPAHKQGDTITLTEPQYAPEGQSLVLYRGERCLGGGIIDSVWLSSSTKPTAQQSPSTNASS
jgi:tRNA-specific 2-thiouridylase